jgi:hypothetical protein
MPSTRRSSQIAYQAETESAARYMNINPQFVNQMQQIQLQIANGVLNIQVTNAGKSAYLNQCEDHKNKHSTEQKGPKEVEIMASPCCPECV